MMKYLVLLPFACSLIITYWLGEAHGRRSAPDYVRMKQMREEQLDAEYEQMMVEYESSQDRVCDQIFELVLEEHADSAAAELIYRETVDGR